MDIAAIADQERVSRSYADSFFSEEEEMEGIFRADIEVLESMVVRKGSLLDVAMGPGRHVRHFLERGFRVAGNDFNMHMVAAARKYVGRAFRCTNHDMRSLASVKRGSCDYVICMGASLGSIYRSRERQKAVSEMSRAAKKGGLVFIHCHNAFEITEPLVDIPGFLGLIRNWLLHREFEFGDVIYYHSDSFKKAYMHWFTPWELRKLMKNAGLEVVKEFYLKGPDQDRLYKGPAFLKYIRSGGFIFVGKKL